MREKFERVTISIAVIFLVLIIAVKGIAQDINDWENPAINNVFFPHILKIIP